MALRRTTVSAALVAALAGGWAWPSWAVEPSYPQELVPEFSAITSSRERFIENYQAGDAQAVTDAFHEEATFAGTLQPFWLEGREAIEDLWSRYFAAWPERALRFRQPTVRFYGDDISVETGYMEMYMSAEARSVATHIRYSITRAKTEKGWEIVNMNVSRLPGAE
jgi:uncharacterized protein (TIGR02246 family)